jgi:hypothetical protein
MKIVRNMPHSGLIDENLPEIEQYLLRARLHIRGGMVRLEHGEISAGIAALYDALTYSLYWYYLTNDNLKPLLFIEDGKYRDEITLFSILLSDGIIDGKFSIREFNTLLEKALNIDLMEFNIYPFIQDFNHLMAQLKIIPFDESSLPKAESIPIGKCMN